MNHEYIKQTSLKRMALIEDRYADYVSIEVQQYYLLLFLLANGVSGYKRTHGLQPLDIRACEEGKELAGFERINEFEKDCIHFLNNHFEREEESHERRKQISLISHR